MSKMDEIIIVAPRDKVFANETLTFQGVQDDQTKVTEIEKLISESYITMRRGDAEENVTFKQPIPYCVIKRGAQVFLYKRLVGGGETRLHDKLSIGAGGHMNVIESTNDFALTLQLNLARELNEELNIVSERQDFTTIGFINDDSSEVSRVHIGLLVILDLSLGATVTVRETEQLEGGWVSIPQLLEEDTFSKLESWSQITAKVLA